MAGRSSFLYPSSIAAYGLTGRGEAIGRTRPRRSVGAADDDVRLQQAVLRADRQVLRAPLQTARRRVAHRPRGLSRGAVSRADFSGHGPVRRHVGLRARDDSCRRARASRTPASSVPIRAFRSWRCRTASTRCSRSASAPREQLHAGRVQRRGLRPDRRRNPRRRYCARFRPRRSRIGSTSNARASSTAGPPTSTTPPRAATGASHRGTTSLVRSGTI